jgi:hemerythrin
MEWTERLSVGVTRFDDEHKKLVALINALFDAVQAGRGREALGKTLDELVMYTQSHFINEELALAHSSYPHLDTHRSEHAKLARQVIDIQQKYHAGASTMLSMEVMSFLKAWLVKHIQGTDQKYAPFLRDQAQT